MGKATLFAKSTQEANTPANQLRAIVRQLERQLGQNAQLEASEILELLHLFDEATKLLRLIKTKGGDWRSEEARLDTALAQFRKRGRTFLKILGGAEKFAALREEHAPAEPGWWWRLDEVLAVERSATLRRWGKWLAGGSIVLLVLFLLYQQFLAPAPELVASVEHQYAAEDLLEDKEYAAALDELNLGLQYTPDKPDMLILKGIVHEVLTQTEQAEQAYARAEKLLGSRSLFLEERGRNYYRMQMLSEAQADAQELLSLEPRSALAQLYLGLVAQARGDMLAAKEHYETASLWADETQDAEIVVIARSQLANLMYSLPSTQPTSNEGNTP